jgi:hypothetical protein
VIQKSPAYGGAFLVGLAGALKRVLRTECAGGGFSDSLILFARTAADAHSSNDLIAVFERDATGKDHDAPVIGGMNSEELVSALRILTQSLGFDVESTGGKGFIDGDIDAADPGALHALESDEIRTGVDDGNVHGLADLASFLLAGVNDFSRGFE